MSEPEGIENASAGAAKQDSSGEALIQVFFTELILQPPELRHNH